MTDFKAIGTYTVEAYRVVNGTLFETSDGGTPEHLLAAMMREPRSQARRIAALVGIDADALAETATAAAPQPASDAGGYERDVDFTPTARLAIETAHAEARFQGDRLTSTQHLLSAMLRDERVLTPEFIAHAGLPRTAMLDVCRERLPLPTDDPDNILPVARDLRALSMDGMLPADAAEFLEVACRAGCNIIVSGPPQSGRTTLLAALCDAQTANDETLVLCTDTAEFSLPQGRDMIVFTTRMPGREAAPLQVMIREAARFRPGRLAVDGGAALDLDAQQAAFMLGANGGATLVVDASSARHALGALYVAGESVSDAAPTLCVSVHLERGPNGPRVASIADADVAQGSSDARILWIDRAGTLTCTGVTARHSRRIREQGGVAGPRPWLAAAELAH